MENLNINLDAQTLEHCLKKVNNIGHTKLINICNGTENTIPWGSMDWFTSGFVSILLVGLIVLLIGLVYMAVRD
jgi:hypothetical protein